MFLTFPESSNTIFILSGRGVNISLIYIPVSNNHATCPLYRYMKYINEMFEENIYFPILYPSFAASFRMMLSPDC